MPKGRRLARGKRRAAPSLHDHPDTVAFATRHRFLLVILWAQVPILAAVGLARGVSVNEIVVASLLLVALGVAGLAFGRRGPAAGAVALGLVLAAGILVRYLGDSTESQYAFLVAITAVSFYRRWRLVVLALAYLAGYHLLGTLAGSGELAPSQAVADPVLWSVLHLSYGLALALLLMFGWRLGAPIETGRGGEDSYRLSFEKAPIGMAVLDPSGEFTHSNEALTRVLGYPPEHLHGSNIRTIVHGDDLDDLGDAWEEMSASESHTATAWMRCISVDGEPKWTRMTLSLLVRGQRRKASVLLQLEDAAEAHREQRRLESIIEGRDEFVAAVGEELARPLAVALDLLTEQPDRVEAAAEAAARIRESAAMVDDLVVSARSDTTPISVVPAAFDAGDLCRETLAGIPEAEGTWVDIREITAWADPVVTRRILNTLLMNAVRYGGPTLTLGTKRSGPDIVIEVIDDGPEVPVSERERIFNGDLRQGRPVTSPATVGLSLTVARRLARAMDGDIEYRRTRDGHNVFELRLPTEPVKVVDLTELEEESERLGAG